MRYASVLIIAMVLTLSGIGGVWAVEKKQKEQPAPKKTEQVKPTTPKETKPKKYDDFIDRNGNGVDDRKENLKKK